MFWIAQVALSNQPEDRAGTPLVVTSRGCGADESGMVDLARFAAAGNHAGRGDLRFGSTFSRNPRSRSSCLASLAVPRWPGACCSPIRSLSPLRCLFRGPCPETPGST